MWLLLLNVQHTENIFLLSTNTSKVLTQCRFSTQSYRHTHNRGRKMEYKLKPRGKQDQISLCQYHWQEGRHKHALGYSCLVHSLTCVVSVSLSWVSDPHLIRPQQTRLHSSPPPILWRPQFIHVLIFFNLAHDPTWFLVVASLLSSSPLDR